MSFNLGIGGSHGGTLALNALEDKMGKMIENFPLSFPPLK